MKKNIKIVFNLLVIFFLSACHVTKVTSDNTGSTLSQKIEISGFSNLYKVDAHLYRSEQPDSKGMIELQNLGIGTVLNVRNFKNDEAEIKGTNMELIHLPMRAAKISYDDMVDALKTIKRSSKKVLVHCKHGSDRTGCIVAAYRMTFCGWTKEQAINEFLDPRFGYHETWFPNILKLLNTFDIEKLKKDVAISNQ
ncbi:MAG: hypothetical protein A3F72_00395 [Bacteroidetes bacterium RIFCSPLOWO2_12_FULL_35_15]|nr:MAG: hypothetical protein A3F72_00395 [Bacteroidetes bacterium RIFCSPLOWO2_12_FULL_35_15]